MDSRLDVSKPHHSKYLLRELRGILYILLRSICPSIQNTTFPGVDVDLFGSFGGGKYLCRMNWLSIRLELYNLPRVRTEGGSGLGRLCSDRRLVLTKLLVGLA